MLSNVQLKASQFEPQERGRGMVFWSDQALVNWAADRKAGWPSAFDELACRHRSWIFKRCLFRLGNAADADDVTQEVMARAYASLSQLQDRTRFKAWLGVVIENSCNTFTVRRARYTTTEHIEKFIDVYQQGGATPVDLLIEQELVHHLLGLLPEKARQVITLRFFLDYSLEQIANTLNLTLSAAKARLYRAIEQIKALYDRHSSGAFTTRT